MQEERETMFFYHDGEQVRIDYVLVYKEDMKKPEYQETRDIYHQNLQNYDMIVHESPNVVSIAIHSASVTWLTSSFSK